ncbi:MAG: deoxyribonuclease IV [Gemmatimonadota bacterium]
MTPSEPRTHERLGAHVSTQGGVQHAPGRGVAIGATAIQIFTKTPSQWREPEISQTICEAFQDALETSGLRTVLSHDSYLINLASPDPALNERSVRSLVAEMERCQALGITALVSHPGNYIEDRKRGIRRNAERYTRCLEIVGKVRILIETTAGCGTALGGNFEELAELRSMIPSSLRDRVGFCVDTCHIFSAGYDLVHEFDRVWDHWENRIGLEHLECFHLNDSKTPFHSCRDRHELIGEGSLGPEPFRRIMTDPRFRDAIKILETPKGDDPVAADRKMLRRLRAYARGRKTRKCP